MNLTPQRIFSEVLSLVAFAVCLVLPVFYWSDLPDLMPVHYGIDGTADGWASKWLFLLLPGSAAFAYLLMSLSLRFPNLINVPWKVTDENRARQLPILFSMVTWLKAEILCMFASIEFASVRVALGEAEGLGVWFLPIVLVTILGTIGLFFYHGWKAR